MSWSNGLKARFAVAEKTDEEISIELQENAYLLGEITLEQWRDVLKVDGRATVLEIASFSGWPAVARYLSVIEGAADGVILEPAALAEARTILLDPLFTG